MKQIQLIVMILGIFITGSYAQPQSKRMMPADRQAKVFKIKLRFFKEKLNMSPRESEAFEAAYRTYTQTKLQLNREFKEHIIRKLRNNSVDNLSLKEQEAIIAKKLEIDKKRYENNRDFTLQLTKILPPEKVIRYFKLERQFNKQMLKRLQKRKQAARRRK